MNKFKSLFEKGGLSLDRLRNFVLVSEAGSVSRAANGDPIRMSLFSKQIKELESFFGATLSRRQGRTAKFTEAGLQLARLARLYLSGLEDFKQTCQGVPQSLMLGGSNSVLEWLVLPQLGQLRQTLPNTVIELNAGRTQDLIRRLTDMTVDLALVREDAVPRPLKWKRLMLMEYSLFLPRTLANGIQPSNLKSKLAGLPLATSMGGQFREGLAVAAGKAGWLLRIELSCSSFTQAARAVENGAVGAVLPSVAAVEFAPNEVVEFPLPFFKSYARPIAAVWNPRLAEVRPRIGLLVDFLKESLKPGG